MVDETTTQELLNFFKALADANRLKIVGLLAQQPLSVEQLADLLEIHPSTTSHHLSRLAKAGLVSARAEGYYSIYYLETKALENMAQRLLERETLPAVTTDVDMDAYDRKVINTFMTSDGRLKAFPSQQKKLEAILRHIASVFEPGRHYSEKEVNELLAQIHEDYASLRRHLVEFKLLDRQGGGGDYWLVEEAGSA